MMIDPTYTNITCDNFASRLQAYVHLSDDRVIRRLRSLLDALRQNRDELMRYDDGLSNERKACPVRGSLSAMCITSVEDYVIPTLIAHGFGASMFLRQFDPLTVMDKHPVPPVHAYATMPILDTELIIDIDADPFLGRDAGVVVVPKDIGGPYTSGTVVHARRVDTNGIVGEFSFAYDTEGGQFTYAVGLSVEKVSVGPYFGESRANWCPIVMGGATMVHLRYERSWVGSKKSDDVMARISLPCLDAAGRRAGCNTYSLSCYGIETISLRGPGAGAESRASKIHVRLNDGRVLEVCTDSNGRILPGSSVVFSKRESAVREVMDFEPTEDRSPVFELPAWQ